MSEQIHANLRDNLVTDTDDSRHTPCSPHGLSGLHNETTGRTVVVVVSAGVVVGGNVIVVVGQVVDSVETTIYRDK